MLIMNRILNIEGKEVCYDFSYDNNKYYVLSKVGCSKYELPIETIKSLKLDTEVKIHEMLQ